MKLLKTVYLLWNRKLHKFKLNSHNLVFNHHSLVFNPENPYETNIWQAVITLKEVNLYKMNRLNKHQVRQLIHEIELLLPSTILRNWLNSKQKPKMHTESQCKVWLISHRHLPLTQNQQIKTIDQNLTQKTPKTT